MRAGPVAAGDLAFVEHRHPVVMASRVRRGLECDRSGKVLDGDVDHRPPWDVDDVIQPWWPAGLAG